MTERVVDTENDPPANSAANNAVEINIGDTGFGTGHSIGQGLVITAAHNVLNFSNGRPLSDIEVTLRRGLSNQGQTVEVDGDDVYNTGRYGSGTLLDGRTDIDGDGRIDREYDFAVLRTDLTDAPTARMIVFENPGDMSGTINMAGYPYSQRPTRFNESSPRFDRLDGTRLNGNNLISSDGSVSERLPDGTPSLDYSSKYDTEYVQTNPDTPNRDGMGATQGFSGAGVQLNTALTSADTRMVDSNGQPITLNLNNNVAGTATYASTDQNGNASLDATREGAGITPIASPLYQAIGNIADDAAQSNERVRLARAAADAAGERFGRGDIRDARENTAFNPLTEQQVADKYASNILVANQSVTNETAARAIDAGVPLSSKFDGTNFNETVIANQNVNMDMNLGPGTDTADYFMLSRSVNVTVGSENTSVQKSYQVSTERPVLDDDNTPLLNDNGTPKTETVLVTRTATDTLTSAENIVGTGSDDTFLIQDLSKAESLDGRDLPPKADGTTAYAENDSLRIDPSVGPVSWTFENNPDGTPNFEKGTVSREGQSVDFDNMETVMIRPGDTVNGVKYNGTENVNASEIPAPAITPANTIDATQGASISTPLTTIVARLEENARTLNADDNLSDWEQNVRTALNHPDAAQMFRTLSENGVESLNVEAAPNASAALSASTYLTAGQAAMAENEFPMPYEQRMAEQAVRTAELEDASYDAMA